MHSSQARFAIQPWFDKSSRILLHDIFSINSLLNLILNLLLNFPFASANFTHKMKLPSASALHSLAFSCSSVIRRASWLNWLIVLNNGRMSSHFSFWCYPQCSSNRHHPFLSVSCLPNIFSIIVNLNNKSKSISNPRL